MEWIKTEIRKPEFGKYVLVYCRIYGRYLTSYESIGEFQGEEYGNWVGVDGNVGGLPPVYWMEIPEIPS